MIGSQHLTLAMRIYEEMGFGALSEFTKDYLARSKRNPALHDVMCRSVIFRVKEKRQNDLTFPKVNV